MFFGVWSFDGGKQSGFGFLGEFGFWVWSFDGAKQMVFLVFGFLFQFAPLSSDLLPSLLLFLLCVCVCVCVCVYVVHFGGGLGEGEGRAFDTA